MKGGSSAGEQVWFDSSGLQLVGDVALATVEPWKSERRSKNNLLLVSYFK